MILKLPPHMVIKCLFGMEYFKKFIMCHNLVTLKLNWIPNITSLKFQSSLTISL